VDFQNFVGGTFHLAQDVALRPKDLAGRNNGTALDTLQHHTASGTAGPVPAAGRARGALAFDGQGDVVIAPLHYDENTPGARAIHNYGSVTASAWINLAQVTAPSRAVVAFTDRASGQVAYALEVTGSELTFRYRLVHRQRRAGRDVCADDLRRGPHRGHLASRRGLRQQQWRRALLRRRRAGRDRHAGADRHDDRRSVAARFVRWRRRSCTVVPGAHRRGQDLRPRAAERRAPRGLQRRRRDLLPRRDRRGAPRRRGVRGREPEPDRRGRWPRLVAPGSSSRSKGHVGGASWDAPDHRGRVLDPRRQRHVPVVDDDHRAVVVAGDRPGLDPRDGVEPAAAAATVDDPLCLRPPRRARNPRSRRHLPRRSRPDGDPHRWRRGRPTHRQRGVVAALRAQRQRRRPLPLPVAQAVPRLVEWPQPVQPADVGVLRRGRRRTVAAALDHDRPSWA
jgi:hypothetical protein